MPLQLVFLNIYLYHDLLLFLDLLVFAIEMIKLSGKIGFIAVKIASNLTKFSIERSSEISSKPTALVFPMLLLHVSKHGAFPSYHA